MAEVAELASRIGTLIDQLDRKIIDLTDDTVHPTAMNSFVATMTIATEAARREGLVAAWEIVAGEQYTVPMPDTTLRSELESQAATAARRAQQDAAEAARQTRSAARRAAAHPEPLEPGPLPAGVVAAYFRRPSGTISAASVVIHRLSCPHLKPEDADTRDRWEPRRVYAAQLTDDLLSNLKTVCRHCRPLDPEAA